MAQWKVIDILFKPDGSCTAGSLVDTTRQAVLDHTTSPCSAIDILTAKPRNVHGRYVGLASSNHC